MHTWRSKCPGFSPSLPDERKLFCPLTLFCSLALFCPLTIYGGRQTYFSPLWLQTWRVTHATSSSVKCSTAKRENKSFSWWKKVEHQVSMPGKLVLQTFFSIITMMTPSYKYVAKKEESATVLYQHGSGIAWMQMMQTLKHETQQSKNAFAWTSQSTTFFQFSVNLIFDLFSLGTQY